MSAMRRRVAGSTFERARQGRRHTPRMTTATRNRSQATPSGSTRVKRRTGARGPR